MNNIMVFKQIVDDLYNEIPKSKRTAETRYEIINLVLTTEYGKNLGQCTLNEIGVVCGLTRERIRQIEKYALGILRHPKRRARIRDIAEYSHLRNTREFLGDDYETH